MLAKCWSEWQDLNLRPPRPERGALPRALICFPALEPIRRHCGVAHGGLDVPLPEIRLKGTRVPALVGEFVAAAVPQHVRMNAEGQAGPLAKPRHHLAEPRWGDRPAALRHEHMRPWRIFPLQAPCNGSPPDATLPSNFLASLRERRAIVGGPISEQANRQADDIELRLALGQGA
jgi:hypothetical protein